MKTVRTFLTALATHPAFIAAYLIAGLAICAAALFGSGELAATFSG